MSNTIMYVWTAFSKMYVPLNTNSQKCSTKEGFHSEVSLGNISYHTLQPPLEIHNPHIKYSEESCSE